MLITSKDCWIVPEFEYQQARVNRKRDIALIEDIIWYGIDLDCPKSRVYCA